MEYDTILLLVIIGLQIGFISIVAFILYFKIENINKNKNDDQKTRFVKLFTNDIEEVLQIYKSVMILAHRKSFTTEETKEKTIELQDFFVKKQTEIENLARDIKFYASILSILDIPPLHTKIVIEKITWLINDFYILKYSVERNKRHWITKDQELRNNNDIIEGFLMCLNNY